MAPSYTKLFMRKLEQDFLQTQDGIPRVWWRHIDDVFAIWTHRKPFLRSCTFVDSFNYHHPTIELTSTWLVKEVILLDTRVYLGNNRIETNLHVKPTDEHQYLRMDSCQLKHCKTSIPYSQALRLRRICSEEEGLH